MSQIRMMVTSGGKHPASKWAQYAAEEIVDISEQAPTTLAREAREFRDKLVETLTQHHQEMMDHEQEEIRCGRHAVDLPYITEDYAKTVRDEICDTIAKDTSFADHFKQQNVREWVDGICNKYFKSAKMVERHHFHDELRANAKRNTKKPASPINKKKTT